MPITLPSSASERLKLLLALFALSRIIYLVVEIGREAKTNNFRGSGSEKITNSIPPIQGLFPVGQRRRLDTHLSQFVDPKSILNKQQMQISTDISIAKSADTDGNEVPVSVEDVPLVYDYKCPDLNWVESQEGMFGKGIDPSGANILSHLSGTLAAVSETLPLLKDRKTIIIGDSLMHQIYISLSCLSHRAGAWESVDSFVADRRVWLKNGSELIYSPWASRILHFNWKNPTHDKPSSDDPFYDNMDWVEACQKREPFLLHSYKKAANSVLKPEDVSTRIPTLSIDPKDHSLQEKVVLTREDTVFVSGSLHSRRAENMRKLNHLFDCMEEARLSNEDHPGWPTIKYIASPPQHFPGSVDGHYARPVDLSKTCLQTVDLTNNRFYKEESRLEGKVSIIGREIEASKMGQFHMGLRPTLDGKVVDCTHWTMPGVTDIYAKEIVNSIF
eukprot:scaffold15293_cov159-Skeletonema_dohrnii-CCMP3373.AAC.1